MKIYKILLLITAVALGMLLPATTSVASVPPSAGKTLIINSDNTVSNYMQVQSAFISESGIPHIDINMGGKRWVDDSEISDLILDEAPDVIYCIGSKAFHLIQGVTAGSDIRIIFSSMINWRRFHLSTTTYGVANELNVGMQMMTYRLIFPDLKRIGILYSKKYNREWLKKAETTAREIGVDLIPIAVKSPIDISKQLDHWLPSIDALWLISDPIVLSDKNSVIRIFKRSHKMKKPVLTYSKVFIKYGATLSVSVDIPTMGGQVAVLAQDMVQQREISTRVQSPAGSYVVLNLQKTDAYGVHVNERALASVNEILAGTTRLIP